MSIRVETAVAVKVITPVGERVLKVYEVQGEGPDVAL